MNRGLGRRVAPDERDQAYPLRAVTREIQPEVPYRYWGFLDKHLDQGATSSCVGHAWAGFIECAPIQHTEPGTVVDPFWIYREAQKVDEWAGESYEGTSVRAGAKVLRASGHIGEYRWGTTLDEVTRHVWTTGPVVLGTDWFQGMFYPSDTGWVESTGSVVGGHAYLCDGVNMERGDVRCLNSWGEDFGISRGRFRMSFQTLEMLLSRDGEAAFATEVTRV